MCRAYAKKFYDLLGDAVYDEDVAGLEETVVHTLQANGLTIATAESCTGGMIAQRLTSVSGASEVFGYGFVTYWEQAKAKLVGVDPAVIAQYNVVSAPVAAQMALGAAKAVSYTHLTARMLWPPRKHWNTGLRWTGTTAAWSTPPCICCTAASGISSCTISALTFLMVWCIRVSMAGR